MGLVTSGLTAEQRRLVTSFAARSPSLSPAARHSVAASLAAALRPVVSGAADLADDEEFLSALAAALENGSDEAPSAEPPPGRISRADERSDVMGRRYLLSRLDDLVAAEALDEPAAQRVRTHIEGELAALELVDRQPKSEAATLFAAPARVAATMAERAEPTVFDRVADATRTFATEETPSLLLYIGAFLVVVAAFIFVNVSGDQISDLVKLVLMVVGTSGFLAAGIVCHRYPRVMPAGRTFLVIGALILPLDVAAYYVLVGRISPLDSPTLWIIGSFVAAAVYAGLRLGGYGIGYSYLFYAAILSALFGVEALVKLPVAWAATPVAALAVVVERIRSVSTAPIAIVLAPLPRMTTVIAALAAAALAIPIRASAASDRAALPVETAFLTAYYALRAPSGALWERLLAVLGGGATVLGVTYAAGASGALIGLLAVAVGTAYLAHEVLGEVDRILRTRIAWTVPRLRSVGLLFLFAGLTPLGSFAQAPAIGAAAFFLAGLTLAALSWVWDERPGPFAELPGRYVVIPAGVALIVAYRFGLAAIGVLPLTQNTALDLARSYAPLSFAAWLMAAAALRSRPHAEVAATFAALLSVGVSVGTFADASAHAIVNALYAGLAAVAAVRVTSRPALWVAALAAVLSANGAYRWSGLPAVWAPLIMLAPAAIAFAASYMPGARALRGTLLRAGAAVSLVATAIGLALSPARIAPWDSDVWRTTMVALAAAASFGALEAWRQRSREVGLLAALALPTLLDMAILTLHPTVPEPLSAPFSVYAFVAAGITRRSQLAEIARTSAFIEYAAATLAIAPTVLLRSEDFATLIASLAIAFALLGAASRLAWPPTARVALVALAWLSLTRLFSDPRIDEVKIAAGALLLAACVVSLRAPRLLRVPDVAFGELVAVALIVVPTAVVTVLAPGASHFDIPIPLLLCIELGALYAVAVVYQRLVLLRATIVISCIAALEFLALAHDGEWYAALLGSAMVNAALALARRWPQGRALRDHAVLGVVGVGVLFLPSLGDSLTHPTLTLTAELFAAAVGVSVAAGLLGERWITGAALGVIAIESLVVMRLPEQLQIPGVATGATLLAIAIAFPRFRRGGLPTAFSTAFDSLGIWLFLLPTFLMTFTRAAALQHAILMAQLVALVLSGLGFRRRWQIIPAIAMIGIEAIRGAFEVVNRIPSFATFALAGALLLAIGFLLLLKRELFEQWRHRFMRWWIAWLAASS